MIYGIHKYRQERKLSLKLLPSGSVQFCFTHQYWNNYVVRSLSYVQLSVTPRTAARQASLSFTNSQSLLKLTSIESVVPSSRLILCHPLLLLPSIFASIRVFSNESFLCIRRPKCWSFSISPSNECSALISCKFHLLAVQGTPKSLLQPFLQSKKSKTSS